MKKYNASNLIVLALQIAETKAGNPAVVTVSHLLYGCLEILTMPTSELLEEVGGDEIRNRQILTTLEVTRNYVGEKEKFHNFQGLKRFVETFLDDMSNMENIETKHNEYLHYLDIMLSMVKKQSNDYPESYIECKLFMYMFGALCSVHCGADIIEDFGRNSMALSEEDAEFISKQILEHRAFFLGAGKLPRITNAPETNPGGKNVFAQIKKLQDTLERTIMGQDIAVRSFINTFKKSQLFSIRKGKPLAVYLLAGPPGVGKTLLAETTANTLDRPYKRIDMSEYGGSSKDTVQGLIGFEPTWKDAAPGMLTSFVDENPSAIILFDEIEKASSSVLTIFLQILNDARLTDKYMKKTVSFENTILIFTTNAGKELYQDNYEENLSALPVATVVNALQEDQNFPNELVSRFAANSIIMFNHINKINLVDIAMNSMKSVCHNARRKVIIDNIETLSQLLLLHEGEKNDARMINAKAQDMVAQALVDYTDFETKEGIFGKYPIHIDVSNEINDASKYLYLSKENPVNVLYLTDKTIPENNWDVEVKNHFDVGLLGNPKHIYRMIVIDPTYGASVIEENKDVLEIDSEGNRVLRQLLQTSGKYNIYVVDDGKLELQEKKFLLGEGVQGFLPVVPDERRWGKLIARHHIMRSQETLAINNEVINYNLDFELVKNAAGRVSYGKIIFENLIIHEASTGTASSRKIDKDLLVSNAERPNVRFKDIIGAENAKRELQQFIKYVKNPEYFNMMGLDMPRGVLLYGPPGTGKTMLAKAAAGECGVSFISVSASDFENKYVGEGEQKIRDMFSAAKRNSPCILFIDEIDTIGKERTGSEHTHHTEKLLNVLLTEMDGFSSLKKKQVFVMAATNFDIDGSKSGKPVKIDPALTRRFPTQIYVDLPSREERVQYVKMYLENKCKKSDIIDMTQLDDMAESIASQTIGKSLAIVQNILDYSLRQFVMEKIEKPSEEKLTEKQMLEYVQEMLFGEKNRNTHISTAYHEACHAFMAWKVGCVPAFLTIVSRDDFGGYVQMKEDEKGKYTEKDMRNKIKIILAGRVGEIIYYKYYSEGAGETELLKDAINTGAGSDLEKATYYAKYIVANLGRNNENLAIVPEDKWSSELSHDILEEVNLLLKVEMDRVLQIAEEDRELIHKLALEAIDKTQLTEKQIIKVLEGK